MADVRGNGSDLEGPFSPSRRGASNMSIGYGNVDRPSMQQDDHPEHNMPAPENDGAVRPMATQGRQMLEDRKNYGRNNY